MSSEWTNQIHQGDVIETLRELPESSVHMVMCSPPYYGLRDYGEETEQIWGGEEDCDHQFGAALTVQERGQAGNGNTGNHSKVIPGQGTEQQRGRYCVNCGAWNGQFGLEPTFDEYVSHLVEIGAAIKRVLREDGSWWLNLGDTYSGGGGVGGKPADWDDLHNDAVYPENPVGRDTPLGRKNKMLIPHRAAIALQEAGWVVRSDCVWAKPNPMPGPWKDRLNETKEFVFHLTPNPDYYFDLDAVREPSAESTKKDFDGGYTWSDGKYSGEDSPHNPGGINDPTRSRADSEHILGKNPGDVFNITVKAFPDAHFAVYPPGLCEKPIKATCPPDGIVLDPFAGAGTTCLVAKQLNRQFIGIELNPKYVAMAQSRIGIDVDDPEYLLDAGEQPLSAFTGDD